MKKFLLEKGPYLRSVDEKKNSTNRMMYDVIIALVPIVLFGWVLNGLLPFINKEVNAYYMLKPLLNVILGCVCSMLFEGLYFFGINKIRNFKELLKAINYSYAVIPGLILSLILPAYVPFYVIVFGCFIANIVFKMLFGGLGNNIFNPALIGYVFCGAAFSGAIADAYATQVDLLNKVFDLTASATPLANLTLVSSAAGKFFVTKEAVVGVYGGLLNLFIGFKSGALGEVSGLLCLVGFIYLLIKKVINWRVPVIYVSTVFIITWIIGIVNGVEGSLLGIWFPTFNILTGGLLFGAIFMATEPVTTPKSPNGKVIFAVGCGVCTVLFRLIGMYPEGVATSILLMCLFTPIIDKFAAKIRGPKITVKIVLNYIAVFAIFLLIALYTITKSTSLPKEDKVDNNCINEVIVTDLGGDF